ncbi:hypothetical protein G7Y89_g119 [Cudoniella acicularis]|uniref:Uncharacterized protein n=1 Tax=Cudoniella acicularis TaxID=354080 RepID=A0A8H4RYU4_9HELO|nr:hypothetical protein G7Y89_g119 [Cudoniella acicularis]
MSFLASTTEEIAPPGTGDLTVQVIEYDMGTTSTNGNHPVGRTAAFRISSVLADNSDTFHGMLKGGFRESKGESPILDEDTGITIASIEVWFRALHKTLTDDSYAVPIEELWYMIEVSCKYLFRLEKLEKWFKTYWVRLDQRNLEYDELRQLLYPCQAFDHPEAFAYVSRWLAHEGVGHMEEYNPTHYNHLHVQGRVIQQINAARGSMRIKIAAAIFDPLNNFCKTNCEAKEKSISAYIDGVKKTGIWPIKTQHRKSNKDVIDSPGFLN